MRVVAIALTSVGLILLFEYFINKYPKKKWLKKWKFKGPLVIVAVFLSLVIFQSFSQPDTQCLSGHKTNTRPPSSLVSAKDYFEQANYDYDIGDCNRAIADYGKAIELRPSFSQALNNRAYTYMRQREYEKALIDLNRAIEIHPDYVNALKNRGDIYNYYFNIDRKKAIEDYDKVISLGGLSVDSSKSICGHRAIAIYGGLSLPTYIKLIMRPQSYGCTMSENKVQ